LAASYTDIAATGAGLVADQVSNRKSAKYADFSSSHIVQPVAVGNLGPINSATLSVLGNPGHRISSVSGDDRETSAHLRDDPTLATCYNLDRGYRTVSGCMPVLLGDCQRPCDEYEARSG